jgi:hypothetical protein
MEAISPRRQPRRPTTVSVAERAVPTPLGTGGRIVIIITTVPTTAPIWTKAAVDQEAAVEVEVDVAVVDTKAAVEVAVATAAATTIKDLPKDRVEARVEASTTQVAPLSTNIKEATATILKDPLKAKAEEEFSSTKGEPISIILMLGPMRAPTK